MRVTLEMEDQELIWSQRNIDVGEPLQPGVPHDLIFEVGSGEYAEPVTITLGMILHKEGWQVSLSEDVLEDIQPGEIREVTLTVTPPAQVELGTGEPIVDVEAFVRGVSCWVASASWTYLPFRSTNLTKSIFRIGNPD